MPFGCISTAVAALPCHRIACVAGGAVLPPPLDFTFAGVPYPPWKRFAVHMASALVNDAGVRSTYALDPDHRIARAPAETSALATGNPNPAIWLGADACTCELYQPAGWRSRAVPAVPAQE